MARDRRFKNFPGIYINHKRAWGNPTVGRTRLPVFKVWELVNDGSMEALMEEEQDISLEQVDEVLGFVEWCLELGLMGIDGNQRLVYDKDALFQAAALNHPPKGKLCMYCGGFIPKKSPQWTRVRDRESQKDRLKRGVVHGACLQAVLCDDTPPKANVFPWKP
jgi:uncharacterized protein (DUF433 family)